MKKGRPPKFTKAQRLEVFETFGAIVCCQGASCDSAIYIRGCHIDHHQAWIDDGEHELENWRPLCLPCHQKKTAHEVSENARAKARHKKHFGQDDKPKRKFAKGQPLRGRSDWPKCPRKMQSRKFPKRQEAQP